MKRISKNVRTIAEILDSDDELPDTYNETADIPAYLNEDRFDVIEEKENITNVTDNQEIGVESNNNIVTVVTTDRTESKILISEGVLSTQDLFIVKSIEEHCSEETLIWFIESLKNKSPTNRVHRSCLAYDISQNNEIFKVNCFSVPNYYMNLVTLML